MKPNPAVDPVRFALWTLRDEAAQRRSPARWASHINSIRHDRFLPPQHEALLTKETEMLRVSVFHESKEGKRFDLDYYYNQHIPMIRQKLGPTCKRIEVDEGLSGGQPGSKPPFIVMTHLFFDSIETFRTSYAPHAAWVTADRPNYTDEPPLLQISEVKV